MNRSANRSWRMWIVCVLAIGALASTGTLARNQALVTPSSVLTGTGTGLVPEVSLFNPATTKRTATVFPFGRQIQTGARVAVGDVNADGVADVVAGMGPGNAPLVKVINGVDGTDIAQFFAFAPGFQGGVFVATGDVNGDGFADVITGAGETGAPLVKVFSGGSLSTVLYSFLAYAPQFTGGVRVASGDVDGDGLADVITGAGAGGPPLVNAYSGGTLTLLASFFAYAPQFVDGVFVASGDVDGDGVSEIITGGGASTGAQPVKVFSTFGGLQLVASFLASSPGAADGITVAAGDVNGDGIAEIVTGTERGAPQVKVFDGASRSLLSSFFAYSARLGSGVYVAAVGRR